jgi:hypothetical protein
MRDFCEWFGYLLPTMPGASGDTNNKSKPWQYVKSFVDSNKLTYWTKNIETSGDEDEDEEEEEEGENEVKEQ